MENSLVSIIVPCYNQAQYLSESLDSVLSQTYSNWECIIVNDGSPDDTEQIAMNYVAKDDRFKYLYQQNHGVSAARNNGIIHSSGKYILPLDADDIICPSYVEEAVNHFIEDPDCKLVYCKAGKFGIEHGEWDLPPYRYEDLLWMNMIFCSAMYKRDDFDRTGGYKEEFSQGCEDWDFWLSLLSDKDSVFQIDKILFWYRIKESSRTVSSKPHFKDICRQIYYYHTDKYEEYVKDIILIHGTMKTMETELNHYYSTMYYNIINKIVSILGRVKRSCLI